jgi:hypothetical protein
MNLTVAHYEHPRRCSFRGLGDRMSSGSLHGCINGVPKRISLSGAHNMREFVDCITD